MTVFIDETDKQVKKFVDRILIFDCVVVLQDYDEIFGD